MTIPSGISLCPLWFVVHFVTIICSYTLKGTKDTKDTQSSQRSEIFESAILKFIIIHLDPITVRILKVNLFYTIGANLGSFVILGPVTIFNIEFIKMLCKIFYRWNTERKMNIDCVFSDLFAPCTICN